jgi:hypothetical protein
MIDKRIEELIAFKEQFVHVLPYETSMLKDMKINHLHMK